MAGVTPFSLTTALQAIGVADVFIGDTLTANGLTSLGAVEGNIEVSVPWELNELTAPELTGKVPHQATATLGSVTMKVPVILGDASLYSKISPSGTSGGGFSTPQKVAETSCVVIPRSQVGGGLTNTAGTPTGWTRVAGNGADAGSGVTAAPTNAVWFWRATMSFGNLPYSYSNGGKVLVEVTFTAMFDVSKPEGHKVYTIGDPTALIPSPIPVKL